jgi:hypothetical protein
MLRDIKEGNKARENGLWKTEVDVGRPNNPGTLCSPCLVALLVSWMFIPKSHVAGHPSGFSGSLVQLRESHSMLSASCWRGTQGSCLGRNIFISTRSLQIPIRQHPCRFSPSLTLFYSAQGAFLLSSDPIGTLNGAFTARAAPSTCLLAIRPAAWTRSKSGA